MNTRSPLVRSAALAVVLCLALAATSCGDSPSGESQGDVPVFDSSVLHEISVEFDEDEYLALVDTYVESGSKVWIEATVTIDGVIHQGAGMRLKGNSSLFGLDGGGRGEADPEVPQELPWLIRLDEFVADRNHQGVREFVVRSNITETSLNEAVAVELLELAGLASQDAIAVAFSVNGSTASLRLVLEHPDDVWLEEAFSSPGALYKAQYTGDYSYRGDDPAAYDDVFDQKAGDGHADLTPLIEFLDFINNADDPTFYGELDERLDTEAFATYLAMQELIGNFDDIDGPGNNSYLHYDVESEIFTVVAWDHNYAYFTGGGGGFGGQGGFGRFGAESNILVDRFLADPTYEQAYEARLDELEQSLYLTGVANEILATWVGLLEVEASHLVTGTIVAEEANDIASFFVLDEDGG